MVSNIATIIAFVGGVGLIVGLVYAAFVGNGDREAEEAARDFYAEHGHWPDEAPAPTPAPGTRREP